MQLILRSKDCGDGWRNVSELLWRLVEVFHHPELLEIDKPNMRIRLSERGKIIAEYLI